MNSKRINIRLNKIPGDFFKMIFVFALALMLVLPGCRRLSGDFGFKTFMDDTYRKVPGIPEIKKSETVDWVFVFNDLTSKQTINVFIMKKELIWVEVWRDTVKINKTKSIIYGKIENMDEGNYKLVISKDKSIISEKDFIIYSDEDDSE